MNKVRRKAIENINEKLSELKDELEALKDEEQESFDNLPESIQGSERGEQMESVIYNMDEAVEYLGCACDKLEELEA